MTVSGVWLFPCEAHINGGVELGYRDLDPQLVEKPAGCIRYETIPDLLERFNGEQATGARPIPGKVICVESRDVHQPENMRRDVAQGDGFSYFQLFSLRIFFYRGLPTRERIQVRDVVPKPLDDYTFEDFTCVLKRASQWLQSESPLKLYNLQTLFVKAKIAHFLRAHADFASLRFPRCLSHHVFIPALSHNGQDLPVAEAIRALKAKMSLWSVGLRGNVLCAESLTVDYDPSGHGTSKINASAPSKSEIMAATSASGTAQRRARVVLYFRVYTDAPEPPEKATAPPASISQPRLNASSVTLSTRSVRAVENRKCRIM
ncbi:hypothetical protein HPB50_003844 [Hyalomma asiaticum]|uniref:Uncharacterized protein n=1 Tax=Hyalomma asiaticum TaxID=266040 RepID=A0ACB7RH37_HYAAI|nr:hypothetical protein HPB50_003844 [Hyalomma asiaticum]